MSPQVPLTLYIASLAAGGAEKSFLTLAEALCALGERVDLVTDHDTCAFPLPTSDLFQHHVLGVKKTVTASPKLAAYWKKARPKAVISGLLFNNLNACLVRTLHKDCRDTPLILTEHSPPAHRDHFSGWRTPMIKRSVKTLYPKAEGLVCVAPALADFYQESLNPCPTLAVIGNPVTPPPPAEDLEALPPLPLDLSALERPLYLAGGRFSAEKNFQHLIRSFAALPQGSLVIFGEGPEREPLETLRTELGLDARVHLPGFYPHLHKAYGQADAVVVPSHYESFSAVIVEALAHGKPVVATDSIGPRFVLEAGQHGLLVPQEDTNALTATLAQAITKAPGTEASRKARAAAFAPVTIAKEYLAFLGRFLLA